MDNLRFMTMSVAKVQSIRPFLKTCLNKEKIARLLLSAVKSGDISKLPKRFCKSTVRRCRPVTSCESAQNSESLPAPETVVSHCAETIVKTENESIMVKQEIVEEVTWSFDSDHVETEELVDHHQVGVSIVKPEPDTR